MDDWQIEYHRMTIEGLEDQRFVVAKLRRFSSPPVLERSVADPKTSALERLADIIRCGPESRNYQDLVAIEPILEKEWGVTAAGEWEAYHLAICQVMQLERLELVTLTTPKCLGQEPPPDLRVSYHEAIMNDRPYLVAKVGHVIGSPSAILLTFPHHRESAFFRLFDVFRIGQQGQVYRDFVESSRRLGKAGEDILVEWEACEQAVLWERMRPSGGP